ncbi:hypothetical protein QTL97_03000 [Sporosarcina thermotolerans]|uniref:Lipoprotein n=1 Tax=Sporosarcina thermotolerans TaxID=633404 RepID=A0AAW9A522_9BACL|nr:hypothetical protein [Sporosarcina thermotolerans]MDW0115910.1 hypothetical protein [Sporosarcina thermotolerans]
MKVNWKLLCTGFATAVLLSACTNSDTKPSENTDPNNSEQVSDETATDQGSIVNEDMSEAILTDSDAQPFSMYVLPTYKLTSEEPGRDSLYSEENPSAFMRIETQVAEEETYEYLLDNMQEVLIASSNGEEPKEVQDVFANPSEKEIKNVKAFKVDTETGPVTGVLFEKDNMVIRLTLFDTPEEEYQKDFLNMGQTIK